MYAYMTTGTHEDILDYSVTDTGRGNYTGAGTSGGHFTKYWGCEFRSPTNSRPSVAANFIPRNLMQICLNSVLSGIQG